MIGSPTLRYAARALRRDATATASAALALAVGIGLTATTFALVDAGLIRPLPFDASRSLVHLSVVRRGSQSPDPLRPDELVRCRDAQTVFVDIAGYFLGSANVSDRGSPPERYGAAWTTPALLRLVGVRPSIGRWFREADGASGAPGVAVISHDLWTRKFDADRSVLGRTVLINGELTQIVGVMPQRFAFPLTQHVWIALRDKETPDRSLDVLGRLKQNVGIGQARAELSTIVARIGPGPGGFGAAADRAELKPFVDRYVSREAKALLGMLFVAVCAVFVIACVDMVILVLARAIDRERDLVIRLALGANRWQLLQVALGEAALLAAPGVLGGILLTAAGIKGVNVWSAAAGAPHWWEMRLDIRVLACICLAGLISVACAALPSVRRRERNLAAVLGDQNRATTSARVGRLGRALVFVQVSLAVALTLSAGLMARTVRNVYRFDYGFATVGILAARVDVPESRYGTAERVGALDRLARSRLGGVSGVTSVALAAQLPGYRGNWATVDIDQEPVPGGKQARWNAVSPGFFGTFRIPLVSGRGFETTDQSASLPVAVVSESFARRRLGTVQAADRRIRLRDEMGAPGAWLTIVGVVRDVHPLPGVSEPHEVYVPLAQTPVRQAVIVLQTSGVPTELARDLRASLVAVDADLALYDIDSMQGHVRRAASLQHLLGPLFALFGGGALWLCVIGAHGVMALAVTRRTSEIGIRVALGGTPVRVVRFVLGQVFRKVLWGTAAGLFLGIQLASALRVMLFGVGPLDVTTLIGAAVVMIATAAVAAIAPAARAVRISPADALRTA